MKKIILAFALLISNISFAVTNKSLVGKSLTCTMSDDRKVSLGEEVYKFGLFGDKFLAQYTAMNGLVQFLPYNVDRSDILAIGEQSQTYDLKTFVNGTEVHQSQFCNITDVGGNNCSPVIWTCKIK